MSKPDCFNRPEFRDFVQVQDGWTSDGRRRMVFRPDNMTKGCHQNEPTGEATIHGWDCGGCRWKTETKETT